MSVIRQKGDSQNGGKKKAKHAKFFEKWTFLTPLIRTRMGTYQGVRDVRFLGNLACFAFLLPSFWDSAFCLITDYFLHKLEKQLNDSYDNQNIDLKTDWYFRLIHLQDLLFEFKTICQRFIINVQNTKYSHTYTHGGGLLLSATLPKVKRFLNCTNGSNLRKASHVIFMNERYTLPQVHKEF